MNEGNQQSKMWELKDRFLELRTKWLTIMGESLQDDHGKILEYWRVEKADSVIILPIWNHHLIVPDVSYRPGIGKLTLDFPGGRVSDDQLPENAVGGILPENAVGGILFRELGITEDNIMKIVPINMEGWLINSAFSNQQLYGFVAEINPQWQVQEEYLGGIYPINKSGIDDLLNQLSCLQCRHILIEWWLNRI